MLLAGGALSDLLAGHQLVVAMHARRVRLGWRPGGCCHAAGLLWLALGVLAGTVALGADGLDALSERYHRERRDLIARELSLSAEEAKRFWPVYEQYERDLERLTDRRRAVIAEFGENYDAMTEVMAKKIMLDRLALDEERVRLRRIYLPRFEKVLPVKKLARYFQIESKIRAAVEAGIAEELPLIQ